VFAVYQQLLEALVLGSCVLETLDLPYAAASAVAHLTVA